MATVPSGMGLRILKAALTDIPYTIMKQNEKQQEIWFI